MDENMTYSFSEIKKQDELIEEKLQNLKREYKELQMPEQHVDMLREKMRKAKLDDRKEKNKKRMKQYAATAAALIGAFIILPNTSATVAYAMEQMPIIGQLVEVVLFRDYKYESERNSADIEVIEIKPKDEIESIEVKENLERTTAEINAEIQKITEGLVEEFEVHLEDEIGYQDVVVTSEILLTTQDYFTIKLLCYQGTGSGYQWNYFYTIDLKTGKRMQLKDVFVEGEDYITLISEDIKRQMQEQMSADDMICYWLNDEIEELNFEKITEDTSFYLNEKNNVVINFDEGDVAPMYMGSVEFEISSEVLRNIRKR